jgi:methyl-accepting chemotaxis protein
MAEQQKTLNDLTSNDDLWERMKVSYWVCLIFIPMPVIAAFFLGEPLILVLIVTAVLAVIGVCAHHFGQALAPHIIGMVMVGHVVTLTSVFAGHPWQMDMHMLFFVVLAVVSTQNNVGAIITTAAVIAVHHLSFALMMPALVYPGSDLTQYMGRTALHAGIVIFETGVLVVAIFARDRLTAKVESQQAELRKSMKEIEHTQSEALAAKLAMSQIVDSLQTGLQKLADQNLVCEITSDIHNDYQALVADFNSAVKTFLVVLSDAAATSNDFQTSAIQLAGAAQDLAQRTEKQAQSLTQAAEMVDGLSKTVDHTVIHAQTASTQSKHASDRAQEGGIVVKNAVSAMAEIEESSKEISEIILVIEDIAFQTYMLALNAAVEAARAGESGRGFSVVATEVRTLAQNTAAAASDVKQLIKKSADHVSRGAALVSQTGKSLEQILASASDANGMVQMIYDATATQAKSLNEVNQVVATLNQSTHANSAIV